MNILLTGSTGFLGSYLVEELAEKVDTLSLLVREKSIPRAKYLYSKYKNINIVSGDITNEELIENSSQRNTALKDTTHIIHAAAFYDLKGTEEICHKQNILGTKNILNFAEECESLTDFHYTSTIAVAGDYNGKFLENKIDCNQSFNNPYARTKYEAEKLVRDFNLSARKRIYRLGILIGNSLNGHIPKTDGPYYFFESIAKLSRKIPYFKKSLFLTLPYSKNSILPIIPVDHAAASIKDGVFSSSEESEKTYHLVSQNPPNIHSLFKESFKAFRCWTTPFPLPRTKINDKFLKLLGLPEEVLLYMYSKVTYDKTDSLKDLPSLRESRYEGFKDSFLNFAYSKYFKSDAHDQETEKFAFIIHPLNVEQFVRHPMLRPVMKHAKKPMHDFFEDAVAHLPGLMFGKITGVRSEHTGQKVEGLIYTVTETTKKLAEKDPEKIYRKLIYLCKRAKFEGAKIIGLGAYTKVVGDQGVTVSNKSPIPVTTGNSFSAAATLWASEEALSKLQTVQKTDGVYQGSAMIVGATGSIGGALAKVMAKEWKKLYIVAPREHKLIELKEEIEKISPETEVIYSVSPDDYTHDSDLIITTTSAKGKRILDIMKVKSKAIICDVSRPLDISKEDVQKREDVLVIASGEVILPGETEVKLDLGLPGNTVFACLAETVVLLMEGRLEPYTIARKIDPEKVIEIDQLARKHGVKLAPLIGHNGNITEETFEKIKNFSLTKSL